MWEYLTPLGLGVVVVVVMWYVVGWGDEESDDSSSSNWQPPPRPDPVDMTVEELAKFDGKEGRSAYVGVNGRVFDMFSHPDGAGYYTEGQCYHCFVGKDSSLLFANCELDQSKVKEKSADDLSFMQREMMMDWYNKYLMKYQLVGYLTDGIIKHSKAQEAIDEKESAERQAKWKAEFEASKAKEAAAAAAPKSDSAAAEPTSASETKSE